MVFWELSRAVPILISFLTACSLQSLQNSLLKIIAHFFPDCNQQNEHAACKFLAAAVTVLSAAFSRLPDRQSARSRVFI